jgi:hypothetical protein
MSSPKILDMDLFMCSKPGVGSAADDPQGTSASSTVRREILDAVVGVCNSMGLFKPLLLKPLTLPSPVSHTHTDIHTLAHTQDKHTRTVSNCHTQESEGEGGESIWYRGRERE